MKRILILFALLQASLSQASPSTTELQQKQLDQLIEIEANTAGGGGTNDSVSATGAAVPAKATMAGGTDGTNLRAIKTDTGGELQIDVLSSALPSGAATSAAQTTGNASLSSLDGKVANNFGASTGAVRSAAQIGNAAGAADFNAGNAGAQTLRVVVATDQAPLSISSTHSYVDSVLFSYADDGPVDAVDWTEVKASLAGNVAHLHIFDSCGQALEFGTGAAAAETRKFIIAPGGPNAVVDLTIASGTRLSVRSLGTTCSTGILAITALN